MYKNNWYSVRRDSVITPDGKPGEYNVVEALDGAFVIAIDDAGRIQFIRKYRYTTDVYWQTGKNDQLAEGINKTEKLTIKEALDKIKSGEITDSQSMSALLLAAFDLGYLK